MSKQALIENVLDRFLTSKELESLERDWKAFYNDPCKYRGTVVVELVNSYLSE